MMKCIVDGCARPRARGYLMCHFHLFSVPRDEKRGASPRERLLSLKPDWEKAVEKREGES